MRKQEIKWHDVKAWGTDWIQKEVGDFQVSEVISIGYVISEEDKQIVLAQSVSEYGYLNVIAIPKEWIVK